MAGNAGTEYLGAVIASVDRQRIARRPLERRTDRISGLRVPARITPSAPPVSNVASSGKNATGPHRRAEPTSVRATLRTSAVDNRYTHAASACSSDPPAIRETLE